MQTIKGFTEDMVGKQYKCGEDVYVKVYDLNKVSLITYDKETFPSLIEHTVTTHMLDKQRHIFIWKDDSVPKDARWI